MHIPTSVSVTTPGYDASYAHVGHAAHVAIMNVSNPSLPTTLHDLSGNVPKKEQVDGSLPSTTQPVLDKGNGHMALERMLSQEPQPTQASRDRRYEIDGRDNGSSGQVLTRTATMASLSTMYSTDAGTLPPPYAEYD